MRVNVKAEMLSTCLILNPRREVSQQKTGPNGYEWGWEPRGAPSSSFLGSGPGLALPPGQRTFRPRA